MRKGRRGWAGRGARKAAGGPGRRPLDAAGGDPSGTPRPRRSPRARRLRAPPQRQAAIRAPRSGQGRGHEFRAESARLLAACRIAAARRGKRVRSPSTRRKTPCRLPARHAKAPTGAPLRGRSPCRSQYPPTFSGENALDRSICTLRQLFPGRGAGARVLDRVCIAFAVGSMARRATLQGPPRIPCRPRSPPLF